MNVAKILALVTVACASCSPVPLVAIELAGDKVAATPEERHKLTQCHRQGGCYIVTQAELAQAFQMIQQQTMELAAVWAAQKLQEAAQSCRRGGGA